MILKRHVYTIVSVKWKSLPTIRLSFAGRIYQISKGIYAHTNDNRSLATRLIHRMHLPLSMATKIWLNRSPRIWRIMPTNSVYSTRSLVTVIVKCSARISWPKQIAFVCKHFSVDPFKSLRSSRNNNNNCCSNNNNSNSSKWLVQQRQQQSLLFLLRIISRGCKRSAMVKQHPRYPFSKRRTMFIDNNSSSNNSRNNNNSSNYNIRSWWVNTQRCTFFALNLV